MVWVKKQISNCMSQSLNSNQTITFETGEVIMVLSDPNLLPKRREIDRDRARDRDKERERVRKREREVERGRGRGG